MDVSVKDEHVSLLCCWSSWRQLHGIFYTGAYWCLMACHYRLVQIRNTSKSATWYSAYPQANLHRKLRKESIVAIISGNQIDLCGPKFLLTIIRYYCIGCITYSIMNDSISYRHIVISPSTTLTHMPLYKLQNSVITIYSP